VLAIDCVNMGGLNSTFAVNLFDQSLPIKIFNFFFAFSSFLDQIYKSSPKSCVGYYKAYINVQCHIVHAVLPKSHFTKIRTTDEIADHF
jgi:hypothetical protein